MRAPWPATDAHARPERKRCAVAERDRQDAAWFESRGELPQRGAGVVEVHQQPMRADDLEAAITEQRIEVTNVSTACLVVQAGGAGI